MHSTACRSIAVATLVACAAVSAHAQTPPIKPGLWLVTPQPSAGAAARPDMSERMKNLSPAARQQVEASLKSRGVEMSGADFKICHTKESLEKGHWQGARAGCKTDFKTRSGATWAWHSSCTQPPSETDGEISFTNAEAYVVKTSSVLTLNGQPRSSQRTIDAKWLASDCGDVKPFNPAGAK